MLLQSTERHADTTESNPDGKATDEFHYLMDFNARMAMAKTMDQPCEFVFVSMVNLTLARRGYYLSRLKTGIKPNTLAALRTHPLQLARQFSQIVLSSGLRNILQV